MTKPDPSASLDAYLLTLFATDGMAADLQQVCKPYQDLANTLVKLLPTGGNRSAALQKLVEAKDSAARAFLSG